MVRQADYIYGIVPERGEYGFEVQPSHGDPTLLARVHSLVSSFQWNATVSKDVVAISVDRNHPQLLARIATDPRDPNGRLSICMEIWITSSAETLEQLIAEVWPDSARLPKSQEEFLSIALQKTSGRIVVGPNESFSAVGFDSSWGVSGLKANSATASANIKSSSRSGSSATTRPAPPTRQSSMLLKVLSTLLVVALLAITGFAVLQNLEIERMRTISRRLAEEKKDAVEKLEKKIAQGEEEKLKKDVEIEKQLRALVKLGTAIEGYKSENNKLQSVVNNSPEKVGQAELLGLRALKASVENYIATQGPSFQELKEAVPRSPNILEELTDKDKDAIQEKRTNR